MKKLIPFILVTVILVVSLYLFRHQIINLIMSERDQIKVGKTLWLDVKPGMVVNSAYINEYDLWDKKEREKVAKYMKENDLVIKEGHYVFNQATTYSEALEIFVFEKIK
ncbi:MAG: hypothetical protein GX279_10155 [Clostridiaceae bacterium]|nr:hypothetical protein [Clostridiaceae bacterium]